MNPIFLLSPAKSGGRRAQLLLSADANFELARRVRIGDATLGEVFSFCSGLYFRGKLAYARRFASPSCGVEGIHIITPSRGLVLPEMPVDGDLLREFGSVDIAATEPRFTHPLRESAQILAGTTDREIVLLGSIATEKYVETLLPVFGKRLVFPREFIGRGDMSRGGLLLRRANSGEELECISVMGVTRRGARPPKLAATR